MTTPRRVSVVVPTYDRPVMFRQALASVRALEGPDLVFEILVGDNGLKEETRKTCEEFGAIYMPAPGKGSSYGRNAAMRAATGEFLTFLDDDDIWMSTNIRPHIKFLDSHPNHDAVFGQAIYTDENLKPVSAPWPEKHPGEGDKLIYTMLSGLFPQVGTLLARREVIEKIGFFDLHLVGGQDLDWLMRIARQRRLGYVEAQCLLFRGRPIRSYDALQRKRIGFDRFVFLRHGLPELHLWKTPFDFVRSYHRTLWHYYIYFIDKAIWYMEQGQRGEAIRTITTPIINLPLLTIADLFRRSDMRNALVNIIRGRVERLVWPDRAKGEIAQINAEPKAT